MCYYVECVMMNIPVPDISVVKGKSNATAVRGVPSKGDRLSAVVSSVALTANKDKAHIKLQAGDIGDLKIEDIMCGDTRLNGETFAGIIGDIQSRVTGRHYKAGDTRISDYLKDATREGKDLAEPSVTLPGRLTLSNGGLAMAWIGAAERAKHIHLSMFLPVRMQVSPLSEVTITVEDTQMELKTHSNEEGKSVSYYLTRQVNLDTKLAKGKKAREFVLSFCVEALDAVVNAGSTYAVRVKGTDKMFVCKETGEMYNEEGLIKALDAEVMTGFFTYYRTDSQGNMEKGPVPATIRAFYISYLARACDKIQEYAIKATEEEDHMVTVNGVMTHYVKRYSLNDPRMRRHARHKELLPLIKKQYPELEQMLAMNVLLNRDNYDGTLKKLNLGRVIGPTNIGKTELTMNIANNLGIANRASLDELIAFSGKGGNLSGKVGIEQLVRSRMIVADEAAETSSGKLNKESDEVQKLLENGLSGRVAHGEEATLYINHFMMLSRGEQGDISDELLSRTLAWDWDRSQRLVTDLAEWIFSKATKQEFNAVSTWYMYDTYSEFMAKSDNELETIIRELRFLHAKGEEISRHKTFPKMAILGRLLNLVEEVDWTMPYYENKYAVIFDIAITSIGANRTNRDFSAEAFVVSKLNIWTEVQELTKNLLVDAKKFLRHKSVNVGKQKHYKGLLGGPNGTFFYPIWLKDILEVMEIQDVNDALGLFEPEHTGIWDNLQGKTLDELLDIIDIVDISTLPIHEIRDLYTTVFIKMYEADNKMIHSDQQATSLKDIL